MHEPINTEKTLVAKLTFSKVVAWMSIALFGFCTVMSYRAGATYVSAFFLVFIALSIFTLITVSSLEMNGEFIAYKSLWANYKISWEEVEKIEMDAQSNAIIFVGKNKKLSVLGPSYWSQNVRSEMLTLINFKAAENQILFEENQWAGFANSKNTKVR